jgi:uncharacterized DUF497 family protein
MAVYYELEFDDDNFAELDRHNIALEDVVSVLDGEPRFFRNRRGRAATRLMIGPDGGGRILAVPIMETPVEGRWRPITAWPASKGEQMRWRNAK